MRKQNYISYLKISMYISCLFILVLLIFFRDVTIINTNTMTKDFWNEYMSRDFREYSKVLLGISHCLIFVLYSLSVVGLLDRIDKYGIENIVNFLTSKYVFLLAMLAIVIMKNFILNMFMEYSIAVYFVTPLVAAFTVLNYLKSE